MNGAHVTHIPQRLLNLGIVLAFQVCYLEWGGGRSAFVGQVHYQVLLGAPEMRNFAHPMIGIPFLGELLVLFAALQRTPGRRLTTIGIGLMSVLVLLLALIAIMSANARIGLSTVPFIALGVMHLARRRAPAASTTTARS